jgi:pimeloyl-ACP methyl ester carboxylesterase
VSSERFASVGRAINLCFEEIGDPDNVPIVLIAGLGQQLISWPTELCETLAAEGMRVIRFDNRDAGRSTHVAARPPSFLATVRGRVPSDAYHLADLARDTVGLLDALGIDRAHLVGASMGGMIAQVVASRWPHRVHSLTSVMSTTGAPGIGRPRLSTWLKMAARAPRTVEDAVRSEVRIFRHIGSHGFAFDKEAVAMQARLAWERDPDGAADGAARQLAAIFAAGDRTAELASVTAPTLVIHGDRDRMVAPTGGLATTRAVRGARLLVIQGLGHDYPRDAWPRLGEAILAHVRVVEATGHPARSNAGTIDRASAPNPGEVTAEEPIVSTPDSVVGAPSTNSSNPTRRYRENSKA